MPKPALTLLACAALALLLGSAPAQAQYKVVAADGRVTYTDRPQAVEPGSQVLPIRRDLSASSNTTQLPADLHALAGRFPVTLYTSSDCAPCLPARRLLQQRGVPYNERTVASEEDIAALQRLIGARMVPALTVGSQALRGLQEADWLTTLELAGYPSPSRLPRGWAAPAATPLVPRPAQAAPSSAPAPEPQPDPVAAPSGSGGIRF